MILAPCVDHLVGPSWFRNRFPCVSPSAVAMSNSVWTTFLTPRLLSTRIKTDTLGYDFVGYQANLEARQFRFIQFNLVHFMFGKRTFAGQNEDSAFHTTRLAISTIIFNDSRIPQFMDKVFH